MASPPVEEELSVEKTLVIVFDDEAKAQGASHAFQGLKTTATSLWTTLRLSSSIRMAALALQKSAVSVDWLEWSLDALSGDSSDCRGDPSALPSD